ncbi:MAG TPA: hypothetical protein VJ224_04045 [Thermoplasmata archaeon]|nr:hypothetical protein [Thermoplasmata archaeon]
MYILEGSLDALPGLSDTGMGFSLLALAGRVEVEVLGTAERSVPAGSIRGFEVATRTTAFLNGTFTVPGGPSPLPATVSGTLTSQLVEFWEGQGIFAVESRDTATYQVDVAYIVPIHVEVQMRTNATTSVLSDPLFPLDVGQRATASQTTDLTANATVIAFGMESTSEAQTRVTTNWSREVLSQESVAVEAGTFAAYRMNQSLSSFPGLGVFPSVPGGNEDAFWSNDVGSYVKRVAYANGTSVAELRLQSYRFGLAGSAILLVSVGLGVLAGGAAIAALVVRRRRRKRADPMSPRERRRSEVETGVETRSSSQPQKEGDRAR